MSATPMRKISPVAVRLPPEFRARLSELAAQNRRSMNSEIVVLLERALFDQFGVRNDGATCKPDQTRN